MLLPDTAYTVGYGRNGTVIRDMYDLLPPERGQELRRLNKERLAALEAESAERRRRLEQLLEHREHRP